MSFYARKRMPPLFDTRAHQIRLSLLHHFGRTEYLRLTALKGFAMDNLSDAEFEFLIALMKIEKAMRRCGKRTVKIGLRTRDTKYWCQDLQGRTCGVTQRPCDRLHVHVGKEYLEEILELRNENI